MKPIFALFVCLFLCACGAEAPPASAEPTSPPPATAPETPAPATEEEAYDDPYLISNGIFLGMKPGGTITEFAAGLRADVLQTGEGDFNAFFIDGAEGNELGYLLPDPRDEKMIGSIFVTSDQVVTETGVRVGMSFAELEERVGPTEVHGSEIEGRTYAVKDGLAYRLEANFWSYEVDRSSIKPQTKLLEIVIER